MKEIDVLLMRLLRIQVDMLTETADEISKTDDPDRLISLRASLKRQLSKLRSSIDEISAS